MLTRCPWLGEGKPWYEAYHDEEWGVPVHDDGKHFELLLLEAAQAGLSWETVLKRREGYRRVFLGFDPHAVAALRDEELEARLQDPSIIRNRLKVFAARKAAQVFLAIQAEFGSFDAYVWRFVEGQTIVRRPGNLGEYRSSSPESEALSKDLKKRGMSFVGSTIIYAYMQAVGLVDEHSSDCFRAHTPISMRGEN